MSTLEITGKNIRDNFCGALWKQKGHPVVPDKSCEGTFDNAFSSAIKSFGRPPNPVKADAFLDSFKIVMGQADELCKIRSEWNYADIEEKQINRQVDKYLRCTGDIIAGRPLPRENNGKTYKYLVYQDKDLPFAQMVDYLGRQTLINFPQGQLPLTISEYAEVKNWPLLTKLYNEALALLPADKQSLAPRIEIEILRWADKAVSMRPYSNLAYIYEVKDDGSLVIKPVPDMILNPRAIGIDLGNEPIPFIFKSAARHFFAEIRRQYFEKSGVREFHPELERRLAKETIAYFNSIAGPDDTIDTFINHLRNFQPFLELNGDGQTVYRMSVQKRDELGRVCKELNINNVNSAPVWGLWALWRTAENMAVKNGIAVDLELRKNFADQFIDKFKTRLEDKTPNDQALILSKYKVETVKKDGKIVYE